MLIRKQLQEELWVTAQSHESLLRQKVRSRWIKEGDCTSRYFHLMMNASRRNNSLKGVTIDRSWIEELTRVKEEVRLFFLQRFQESDQDRPRLDGICFLTIGQQQNDMLLGRFQEDEVKNAVWDCGSEKSPGSDGLNLKFIKIFWHIIKPDVLWYLDEFYVNGTFPRGCNAFFIALIPKVADPQLLNDYRPISLIGCIYKIVAKLLSNRLKKVMPLIIDERQSAFIGGRHLLHSVLIANEVVEEAKRSQKSCIVFKVDYEKAYDSVSWEFLIYMLRRMGLCSKWIQWIEGCLKSASILVLVNGSPSFEFIPQRGLRQGDPLAPLLFDIVAEALNGLVREAVEKNLFRGFPVGSNNVEISILQYADDTIFFGETSMENVNTIKVILRTFELVSDLKINFVKSCFGAFGMSDQWKLDAANYLNCSLLSIPFVYLGISIGTNPRRCQLWDPILNKCERKLAKWKQRYLSFGGRVTLIQSVLTSIPIYFFSFFRVPKRVVDKLVSLQRRFLWGGGSDQNKIAWIKWDIVCLPKEKGGLGIKDINTFNLALLGKWKWNLFQHQGQLWARLLESKYGGWRSLNEASRDNNKSIRWRDLKMASQHLQQGDAFQNRTLWRVGCGDRIKFREDNWIGGEGTLLAKYPRLYLISCQQNQVIQ